MDVERIEAGARERGRHLVLPVDALLAQDGDARPRARVQERRGNVFRRLVGQRRGQAGRIGVEDGVVLLPRAGRIVPQALHRVAQLGPRAMQIDTGVAEALLAAVGDPYRGSRHGAADHVDDGAQPGLGETRPRCRRVRGPHLDHRAELLAEQDARADPARGS